MRCPICDCQFEPGGVKTLPFCSPRCQQIDLGRWLGESYAMPVVSDEDDVEPSTDEIGVADND